MQVDEDNDSSQKDGADYGAPTLARLFSYRKVVSRFERLGLLRFDRISEYKRAVDEQRHFEWQWRITFDGSIITSQPEW